MNSLVCKSPIRWYGAKARTAKLLLHLLPSHHRFADVFGGSASMLLQKERCGPEILNDLQSDLIAFWRVVKDPILVEELVAGLRVTSIQREEYEACNRLYDCPSDPVEKARQFFVLTKLSFNGCFRKGWSDTTAPQYRSSFPNAVERLAAVHRRLQGVTLENLDFRELIPKYDALDTCLFLDPPYVHATRKTKKRYQHEMSDFDHEELIRLIKVAKSSVVLSGYAHPIYDAHLKDWMRVEIPVRKPAAQGAAVMPTGTEIVWIKPASSAACKADDILPLLPNLDQGCPTLAGQRIAHLTALGVPE